ncbi:MAG: ribosomal RNA small subunit methyltransferase A [Candidatus Eremiobacteraeota bacterium]|nr:ribosomal RNA small subunit methyltransferase A [Candidatus Eremiobacteraeota bacterium]
MAADPAFSSPKQLLDARHLRPRKRFGQNFLTDPRVASRIAAALPHDGFVIEIGGGTGTLSAALASIARELVVVEIDRDLSVILRDRFDDAPNVRILTKNILELDLSQMLAVSEPPRAVCGNLPYYITTPILEQLLQAAGIWQCSVLMVQREYAQRLVARAGTPAYGSLSVYASYFADIEKLFDVGAAGFYPNPQVRSSVVRLSPKPKRAAAVRDEALLLWLIRAAFRHRRKTLVNSLLEALPEQQRDARAGIEGVLAELGHDRHVRGERLTLAEFCRLADTLKQQHLLERSWTSRLITTP